MVGVNQDSIPGAIRPRSARRRTAWSRVGRARTKSHGPRTTRSRSASSTWQCRGQGTVWRSTAPRQVNGGQSRYRSSLNESAASSSAGHAIDGPAAGPRCCAYTGVFSGTPRFSSEAVALYESCGRRFLYTHLLQVGGRRRMSAFMLMHEAIRRSIGPSSPRALHHGQSVRRAACRGVCCPRTS
jgi:hypothetical protein